MSTDFEPATRSAFPQGTAPLTPPRPPRPPRPMPPSGHHRPARFAVQLLSALLVITCGGALLMLALLDRSTQTQNFTEAVTQVQVNTDTGDVAIHAAEPGADTSVVTRTKSIYSSPQHTAVVRDGVLMVSGSCRNQLFLVSMCSVDFDITVQAGARIQAHSSTGDVQIRSITGPVTAAAGDGDVRLEFGQAPDQARAGSDTGDVRIELPGQERYRVEASTGTGDTKVSVPVSDSSSRIIQASTGTGDVTVTTNR